MTKLVISLFTPFQILLNKMPVTQSGSVKLHDRLEHLAAETTHPQPHESLAALLWPD